jgi:hypothetical protein
MQLETYSQHVEDIVNRQLVRKLSEEVLKHLAIERVQSNINEVTYTAKAFFLTEEEHNEYKFLKNRMWEL